jgi:hypothetical protein
VISSGEFGAPQAISSTRILKGGVLVPTLEQIDILRERTGASYREAKEALIHCNDDVVDAIIWLEEKKSSSNWMEHAQVRGSELLDAVKRLIQEGNVRRIRVLQNGQVLIEFPVTAGALGALLAPQLAAVGVIAALITRCTVEIERVTDERPDDPPPADPME